MDSHDRGSDSTGAAPPAGDAGLRHADSTVAASAVIRHLAARCLMPGFTGTELPEWVRTAYRDGLRAVCLYGSNIVDPDQFSHLCGELRALGEITVALDEEGGDVTRVHYLHGSPEPGNGVLGRIDDPDATRSSARRIGQELDRFGVTLALAPVADINSSPENPVIGARSFGTDPDLVGRHTAQWIEGMQETGVAACAKHFPGHGDTNVDSHHGHPVVTVEADLLRRRELVPFRAAIAAGVATMMTSHIVFSALDPEHPATFSKAILSDLLRGRLGFTGAIVTDALDMKGAGGGIGIPEAAVRALAAGCDLLCTGSETTEADYLAVLDAVVAAVLDGRLPLARLRDAGDRAVSLVRAPGAAAAHLLGDPKLERTLIRDTFTLSVAAHEWLIDPAPIELVQVDSIANPAVGFVPWGPASILPEVRVVAAGSPDPDLEAPLVGLPADAKVAVVGRDVGPGHTALVVAARLRAAGHRVIVIDCGWPRDAADIATRGGSRAVSQVLVDLLMPTTD